MKRDDISDALNHLDEKIIEETNEVRQHPRGRITFFQKYQSLIAGFAVTLLVGTILGSFIFPNPFSTTSDSSAPPDKSNSTENEGSSNEDLQFGANNFSGESESALETSGLSSNKAFLASQMSFALELFQTSAKESAYENVLVSPLSMMQALSMTANGAAGNTASEMTQVLGGSLSLTQLNEWLKTYINILPSANQYELQLANSIWIREDANFTVKESFLNTNKNYYHAQIFTESFSEETVEKINDWVKTNTNNHISEILEEIDADTVMYLINALAFDAQWEEAYSNLDVSAGQFTSLTGATTDAEMMHSAEHYYLDDGNATGFIKDYKDGAYRFVALLPNENISLSQYIESLTSDALTNMIANAEKISVGTSMPKFSYEYELEMNDVLKEMGIRTAFESDKADFSELGISSGGNLYVGKVLHKTFISVNENGTQAGAASSVEIKEECAVVYPKEVVLNRPFVYMILDGATNLPVFIGTVTQISQ